MIRYSAISQKGKTKMNNEDRVMVENRMITNKHRSGLSDNSLTAIVCDGVGSTKGGAYAAELVAKSFLNFDINYCSPLIVSRHLHKVNRSVLEKQKESKELHNMASTVAGIIIKCGRYLSFNLGDTRIYKYHNGKLSLITKDHIATNPCGFFEPNKTAITSYIGGSGYAYFPFFGKGQVENGCMFLMCSDGVYKNIKDNYLKGVLGANITVEKKERAILKLALQNGSTDDRSLVLVECAA